MADLKGFFDRYLQNYLIFIQIKCTPPDERQRRAKLAHELALQERTLLVLAPFQSAPKLDLGTIKLGKAVKRTVTLQNTTKKLTKVQEMRVIFNVRFLLKASLQPDLTENLTLIGLPITLTSGHPYSLGIFFV